MPYKGGRRDKAKLLYREEVYTPDGAKSLTDKQLRKEYTRLRSIARKRLERFEGTEWTDTQIYKQNVGQYKPLKEIQSNRDLRYLFSELANYITTDTSSVSGLEKQREKGVQTLNERGYEFVTKQNYRKFGEFMEYARAANLNKLYDSKRVADFYDAAEKRKISGEKLQRAFRLWRAMQKNEKKIQNVDPRNSSYYRQQIDTGLEQIEKEKYFKEGRDLITKYQNKKGKKK